MADKKKFRLRSRYAQFRFRNWKFNDGMLETDDPKVIETFKQQPFFGAGGDVWLDDTAETDALVAKTTEATNKKS